MPAHPSQIGETRSDVPFRVILKELVDSVEGAEGAILLDADGEAVQWHAKIDGMRLQLRGAYLAVTMQAARAAASSIACGDIQPLIVRYEQASYVLCEIDDKFFIALELCATANVRLALERSAPIIERLIEAIGN